MNSLTAKKTAKRRRISDYDDNKSNISVGTSNAKAPSASESPIDWQEQEKLFKRRANKYGRNYRFGHKKRSLWRLGCWKNCGTSHRRKYIKSEAELIKEHKAESQAQQKRYNDAVQTFTERVAQINIERKIKTDEQGLTIAGLRNELSTLKAQLSSREQFLDSFRRYAFTAKIQLDSQKKRLSAMKVEVQDLHQENVDNLAVVKLEVVELLKTSSFATVSNENTRLKCKIKTLETSEKELKNHLKQLVNDPADHSECKKELREQAETMTENFTERLKQVSTVAQIPTSSIVGNSLWKQECDQFIGQCSKKIIEREDLSAQYNKLKCILELSFKSQKPS